ncbi:para-nitrobenzyl esterase [Acidovorax soli]|uniref:Carboxylic ester hydrolase n=1 Tax=Acidovorax soli TaxID=592050 RepID=A0A7X0UBF5_9BURK|nr:carboxylesterase family protein [Acidovorax soli]MBB6562048.1 para-nitrobenzyl esterase [Acidovorax soli]
MPSFHTALAACMALCLALTGCGGGSDAPADPGLARTSEGLVRGQAAGELVSFLGIPYAAQPVGALRWAPTAAAPARTDTLKAERMGPSCPQSGPGADTATDEACLYLNVWKPAGAAPGAKLPVLVFMHGGAFVLGSGAQTDLREISRRQVVTVSFNYRLGALGYLANPALRAANKDGSMGNFALMDAIAALQWVRRNIEAFGGDAGNITLWGLSAGATQTFSLLHSPKARGLFHRAMMQSGGGAEYSNLSADAATAVGDAAVKALGCAGASDQVACLRALPVAAILAAQGAGKWRPTVDGQVLTQVPLRAFATGDFNRVPVMVGGVYDEGTLFSDPGMSAAVYPLALRSLVPPGFDTAQIDAAYALSRFSSPGQGFARATGDAMYACGNSVQRSTLSAWVPVFGWEMTDPAMSFPAQPKAYYYGSSHGMDAMYWAGGVDFLPSYPFLDAAVAAEVTSPSALAQRKALSERMLGHLVNFMRMGDPNGAPGSAAPAWPRFAGATERHLMHFTLPQSRVSNGEFEASHQCALWPVI